MQIAELHLNRTQRTSNADNLPHRVRFLFLLTPLFGTKPGNLDRVEERCYAMAKRMQYLLPNILDLTYPYVSMLTGRCDR